MNKKLMYRLGVVAAMLPMVAAAETDVCKGRTPGTVTFFAQEVSRDAPLPPPVTTLEFGKPMYAVACFTDEVKPETSGGPKLRAVLYVKQINLPAGKYSSYKEAKQEGGVFRPELSKPRSNLVIWPHEEYNFDSMQYKLDPGEYEFRLQVASETGTGNYDVTFDLNPDNPVAYIQELRKAGYLATGGVKVIKKK